MLVSWTLWSIYILLQVCRSLQSVLPLGLYVRMNTCSTTNYFLYIYMYVIIQGMINFLNAGMNMYEYVWICVLRPFNLEVGGRMKEDREIKRNTLTCDTATVPVYLVSHYCCIRYKENDTKRENIKRWRIPVFSLRTMHLVSHYLESIRRHDH